GASSWADIKIIFLGDQRVEIVIHDEHYNLGYAEFGFEDRRSQKPNSQWLTLREIAKAGGTIYAHGNQRKKLEKPIQKIRAMLKKIFRLPDDPFDPYDRTLGYRSRFRISFPDPDRR